jgi:signal transduction histidine kinase
MPLKLTLFLSALLIFGKLSSQPFLDSINKAIKSTKDEKRIINLYYEAGNRLLNENSSQAIEYFQKAYTLASSMDSLQNSGESNIIVYKSLMAKTIRQTGMVYRRIGLFNEANESLQKSLVLYVEIGDKPEIAESLVAIGNNHLSQGNSQMALKYFEKALVLQEEMIAKSPNNDELKRGMAACLVNIAKVSLTLNNYQIVSKYIEKALTIYKTINDEKGLADCNFSISRLFFAQEDYEKALAHINSALLTYQKNNDNTGIANSHNQVGKILTAKADYVSAIKSFLKAKQIYESIGNVQDGLKCLNNIAELYNKLGFYQLANEYSNQSLPVAIKLDAKYDIKITYYNMAISYQGLGNQKLALDYYIKFHELSEKLFNEETSRQLHEMEIRYQTEQQQQKIELQEIALAKRAAESRQLSILLYAFIGGFVLMLILAIVIYKSYQHKQKANILLASQKREILAKNSELLQQKEEITNHRNEIERQRDELKQLNATKDKFFSIIAHDLKNPFATLLGFSDLLISGFDTIPDNKKLEFMQMIHKSGKETYELLENLLQWSRSQRGQIEFMPTKCDLYPHIASTIDLLQFTAHKKEIKLNFSAEQGIMVSIDEKMFNTVLRNLISNALKFTKAGGEVKVSVIKKESYAEINVIDSGVGIKEADLQKLFRIDVHHSTSGTAEESGTGLGLILCKEFVEKNGGKIYVQSTYGKGSIFSFTVKLA